MSSYWIDSCQNNTNSKEIANNYICDICIIGAGICGLSTAYYLSKNGLKVILVDRDDIGQKVSGNTTAKITFQHNLIYDYLINSFGIEFASKYLKSNFEAINNIKEIIDSENIDCDFEYQNNYIYTTNQDNLYKIHNEVKSLNILANFLNQNKSISVDFVTDCPLPFNIVGGVQVKNQAQFNPSKYMLGLKNAINNYGGLIFTHSLASDVKRYEDSYITYVNNYIINSKYVVIASHYPFINFPGFYFSKMYKSTSYVLGINTFSNLFDGMYINADQPTFSFRTAPYQNQRLLILSGADHKTGYNPEYSSSYKILEDTAKKLYPNCEILYRWNTCDCISIDKIPYIGNYSSFLPNMFTATGFNKWGMTSSNVAANIITDKILGHQNEYSSIYNSLRFSPLKNKTETKNMSLQTFKSLVTNKIKVPDEDFSKIENDNGAIIKIDGSLVGIYKDSNGKIFAVNPACSHLGCLLTWNNLDKTWDCPCHGSRFDYNGKNIYGPALKDLTKYDV